MRRILFGFVICMLCVLSIPNAAYAQAAQVPRPDKNGDFLTTQMQGNRGTYQIEKWSVVNLDPNGLNCRTPANRTIMNGPIAARFSYGSVLEAALEPGSTNAIVIADNKRAWLQVRSDRTEGTCFVRANAKYIAPINPDV